MSKLAQTMHPADTNLTTNFTVQAESQMHQMDTRQPPNTTMKPPATPSLMQVAGAGSRGV